MAKYRLEKNRKKSVNCEVLHENLNGYIVRFDNGMIKNVKKSNVYALDRIDEAVLDDIRGGLSKFGKQVADVARYVGNKIKNAFSFIGGTLFFMFKGKPVFANHPINIMELAKDADNVGFIPSTSTVELCNDAGVDVVKRTYKFDNSGYGGSFDTKEAVNESKKISLFKYILNEDFDIDYMTYKDPDTNEDDPDRLVRLQTKMKIKDYPGSIISYNLHNTYTGLVEGKVSPGGARSMPVIYGAPGIGKSTIVQNFADELAKENYKNEIGQPLGTPAVITVNATTIHPESFTLPAKMEEFIRNNVGSFQLASDYTDDYEQMEISTGPAIQDLPKNWLPVYNSVGKTKKQLEVANAIANGGAVVKDKKTGEEIVVNGPGGLFFLDEFSRMGKMNFTSLMTLVTGNNLGNGLLFGDRWIIVGAANRNEDENDGETTGLIYSAALDGRVVLWNYVPNPNDWKKWALKINKVTGTYNVLPEVVDFVMDSVKISEEGFEYSGNVGYYYYSVKPDNQNESMDFPRATPRRWEMVSNEIRSSIPKGVNLTRYLTDLKEKGDEKYNKLMYTIKSNATSQLGSVVGKKFSKYIDELCNDITPEILDDILKNGVDAILDRGAKNKSRMYVESTTRISPSQVYLKFVDMIIPLATDIRTHLLEREAINLFDFAWYMLYKDMNTSKPGFSRQLNGIVTKMRNVFNIKTTHEADEIGVANEYREFIQYVRERTEKVQA